MFCHIEWNRIKADIALQPLPAHSRHVIDVLLHGEGFDLDNGEFFGVLNRLYDLNLIDEEDPFFPDDPGTWRAGWMLRGIEERGLLDELLGDRR